MTQTETKHSRAGNDLGKFLREEKESHIWALFFSIEPYEMGGALATPSRGGSDKTRNLPYGLLAAWEDEVPWGAPVDNVLWQ